MIKVHILATCQRCNGDAYLPMGEAEDCHGQKYIRHIPCPFCQGSGNWHKWIDLQDFAKFIQ